MYILEFQIRNLKSKKEKWQCGQNLDLNPTYTNARFMKKKHCRRRWRSRELGLNINQFGCGWNQMLYQTHCVSFSKSSFSVNYCNIQHSYGLGIFDRLILTLNFNITLLSSYLMYNLQNRIFMIKITKIITNAGNTEIANYYFIF